jgi:HlyD family secretion protein
MIGRVLLAVLLIVTTAWAVYNHLHAGDRTALIAYGTLEARNIEVGSKIGGRVAEVLVREGDQLRAGQLIVRFEADELTSQVEQALAHVRWAEANVAKMKQGSRTEDIAEAQAAAADGDIRSGFRSEEVAQARAEHERARAEAINAERLYKRTRELAATGASSRQSLDDAEARLSAARALVRSTEHAVAAAEGRLKAAAAVTMKTERGFRVEDLAASEAELEQARAQLREMQTRLAEREIFSPAEAVVEVFDLQPGDLVAPNAIVAKLLKPQELYAMVYVPETRLIEVRAGMAVTIHVDSFPDKSFAAHVEQVRQQAEFLPRNVQTREERVHQVFGVKLRLDDPATPLRPGISIEAHFPLSTSP